MLVFGETFSFTFQYKLISIAVIWPDYPSEHFWISFELLEDADFVIGKILCVEVSVVRICQL